MDDQWFWCLKLPTGLLSLSSPPTKGEQIYFWVKSQRIFCWSVYFHLLSLIIFFLVARGCYCGLGGWKPVVGQGAQASAFPRRVVSRWTLPYLRHSLWWGAHLWFRLGELSLQTRTTMHRGLGPTGETSWTALVPRKLPGPLSLPAVISPIYGSHRLNSAVDHRVFVSCGKSPMQTRIPPPAITHFLRYTSLYLQFSIFIVVPQTQRYLQPSTIPKHCYFGIIKSEVHKSSCGHRLPRYKNSLRI